MTTAAITNEAQKQSYLTKSLNEIYDLEPWPFARDSKEASAARYAALLQLVKEMNLTADSVVNTAGLEGNYGVGSEFHHERKFGHIVKEFGLPKEGEEYLSQLGLAYQPYIGDAPLSQSEVQARVNTALTKIYLINSTAERLRSLHLLAVDMKLTAYFDVGSISLESMKGGGFSNDCVAFGEVVRYFGVLEDGKTLLSQLGLAYQPADHYCDFSEKYVQTIVRKALSRIYLLESPFERARSLHLLALDMNLTKDFVVSSVNLGGDNLSLSDQPFGEIAAHFKLPENGLAFLAHLSSDEYKPYKHYGMTLSKEERRAIVCKELGRVSRITDPTQKLRALQILATDMNLKAGSVVKFVTLSHVTVHSMPFQRYVEKFSGLAEDAGVAFLSSLASIKEQTSQKMPKLLPQLPDAPRTPVVVRSTAANLILNGFNAARRNLSSLTSSSSVALTARNEPSDEEEMRIPLLRR